MLYFFSILVDKPKWDEQSSTRNFFKYKENALTNEPIARHSQNDIKKIIRKPKTLCLENPSLTTGRLKKVQFNTLPEFSTQRNRKGVLFFPEFNNESSLDTDFTQDSKTNNAEERLPLFRSDGDVDRHKSKYFYVKNL